MFVSDPQAIVALGEICRQGTGTCYDEVLGEFGVSKDDLKQLSDRDISLPGDYRRLLCIPSDTTFEVKIYEDPVQPLLETDLMKITATEVKTGDGAGVGEKAENAKADEKEKNHLIGMVIGFTLPPSSYATIALRELMKKPTSADYQRQLQLSGGNCESTLHGGEEKDDSQANGNAKSS